MSTWVNKAMNTLSSLTKSIQQPITNTGKTLIIFTNGSKFHTNRRDRD